MKNIDFREVGSLVVTKLEIIGGYNMDTDEDYFQLLLVTGRKKQDKYHIPRRHRFATIEDAKKFCHAIEAHTLLPANIGDIIHAINHAELHYNHLIKDWGKHWVK